MSFSLKKKVQYLYMRHSTCLQKHVGWVDHIY